MLHIKLPIIVEGKYDKARLAQVVDAPIITTDGFGIFNNREKTALIRRLAVHGVILLCDSDGGGSVIRSFLKGIIPPEKVYNLYVPQIAGKERRKRHGSKAGFLGVEGIDNGILASLFDRLAEKHPEILAGQGSAAADAGGKTDPVENAGLSMAGDSVSLEVPAPSDSPITKTDLYLAGLTGGENAAEKRDRLCAHLGFPAGMTPTAFLAALNILYGKGEFAALCETVFPPDGGEDEE
ncbi:MAG: DUF4093 domain-containing protein [Clostridia bacterium]|nr:DUF4093 domain-containing protein [Clostridia bacterium]